MRVPLVLVATLALGACALQRPPERDELQRQALPHLQMPESWASRTAAGGSVQDGWLASFNDARLNQLATEALQYNADLQVAAARVEQAAGYARVAASGLYPAVNALARGGGKMSGDNSGLQGAGLIASWELDIWGRVRYGRAAGQAQFDSARADLEYARQSLVAMIAKSWFLATEAKMQRQVGTDSVRSAESLVNLARARERVGRASTYDVAAAQATLETYRDSLRALELAYQQALRALELLLGRYPAAQLEAPDDLSAMPPPIPAGLPSDLLERRPDIIAAERRVAAAFNRTGEARAARLPRISLTAGVNSISSDLFVLQDRDNPVWSAGASLLAPIFQGGALAGQVDVRNAEQKQAVAQYAQIALRALGEVENALASEIAFQDREQILQRAVAENDRALELAKVAFNVGSIDMRPVQQQQLALYATRSALVRVRSEQRLQRIGLHLALGGGWERTTPSSAGQGSTAGDAPAVSSMLPSDVTLQDRTQFSREGSVWVFEVVRERGIGAVQVSPTATGWPPAMVVRFRGFPALESVTAKAGAGLLTCELQRPEGRPAAQTCRFNGAPMAALQKDGDRYQLDVPARLLAGQPSLELRWIDQWR